MKLIDPDHPFFRPVWRRWVTALFPLCWAGVEIWHGSALWAAIFAAVGTYAFWALILRGPGR